MSEFPSLAAVLREHLWYFVGNLGVPGMPDCRGYKCQCGWSTGDPDDPGFVDPYDHVADAWREACTVHTVEELDALPPESVIKTEGGSIACRHFEGVGVVFGDDRPFDWSALASELPGLLIHHPDWEQP